MKQITLLILCLALAGQAQAQRYLPGQRGIQFTLGAVDGFKLNNGDEQAFCFGLAVSTYTQNGNHWVFGAEYLQKKYSYEHLLIPVSQITAEGGYYLNFLSSSNKVFFVSLGASGMAGYETVNWGKEQLFDGSRIANKDKFVGGGAITLESEIFLSDRFVLLVNIRERVLFGSTINKFHTQLGLGCKFIIN